MARHRWKRGSRGILSRRPSCDSSCARNCFPTRRECPPPDPPGTVVIHAAEHLEPLTVACRDGLPPGCEIDVRHHAGITIVTIQGCDQRFMAQLRQRCHDRCHDVVGDQTITALGGMQREDVPTHHGVKTTMRIPVPPGENNQPCQALVTEVRDSRSTQHPAAAKTRTLHRVRHDPVKTANHP